MKTWLLSLVSLICTLSAYGQTVADGAFMQKLDTPKIAWLDQAEWRIYYRFQIRHDVKIKDRAYQSTTLLQVENKYNRFVDYATHRCDSIYRAVGLRGGSAMEAFPMTQSIYNLKVYDPAITILKSSGEYTHQESVAISPTYEYTGQLPKLDWVILDRDTTILGYPCHTARTEYAGRKYIAWYTEDIPIPYGPHKFSGLPGLILTIQDTEREIYFEMIGIERVDYTDPIYSKVRKVVKISPKELARIIINYHQNPGVALKEMAGTRIKIKQEDLDALEPRPYNPIERE